jgi:hypothetical protein
VATREAEARGWDPDAGEGMQQKVEESTATLLPAAEQILQELEKEARASCHPCDQLGGQGIPDPE